MFKVTVSRLRGSTIIAGGLFVLMASTSEPAHAETGEPKPGIENLPTVTVQTPRRPRRVAPKQKRTAAVRTAPAPQPVVSEPSPQTQGERGTGPVRGVVATQSVTGTKTDTPILETPQSLSVVTQAEIASQQSQTLPQALRYVPGVVTEPYGASSLSNDIKVRGFNAPRYLDGLRLPIDSVITFAQARVEPWGLERIEVLKGPSSGLYGETSPGGLISMVSKRPTSERQNQVELQTGSFNRIQAAFDFSGPIDPERQFLYRVVGLGRTADTVIDFTNEGRAFVAPSFTWQPTADTSFTILTSFDRDNGDGQPQQYVPGYGSLLPNINGRIPYSRNLGEPSFDHWRFKQDMAGYAFEHRFNEIFQFRQNLRFADVHMDLTSMRSDVAFPDMLNTLRSAFDIRSRSRTFGVDNQVQADFRTGPLLHKLLVGVDYQQQDSFAAYGFGFGYPLNIFNPVYGQVSPNPATFTPAVRQASDQDQIGIYLQDQIKLERWVLTLTGRHDHWQARTLDYLSGTAINQESNPTTGRVGLSYVFDIGVAPYVSYSTSFEPVIGLARVGRSGSVFQPTTGEGAEVGVKYQPLGLNALFTAAAFEITKQNVLTADPVDPLFSIQTGEVRVRGVELDVKINLTDRLEVIGGVTHIEPVVTQSTTGNVGFDLVNVPRDYASLWTKYTFRDGPAAGFGLGGGVRYIGASYVDALNTIVVPSYTLFDATASYDFVHLDRRMKGLTAQINVTNIFNKYYVATCFTGLAYCGLGAPRTVLGTLKYAWN